MSYTKRLGRIIVQLVGLGIAVQSLVTLPFLTHPALIVFAVFTGLEIAMYVITTFRTPKAITTNALAWLASLLIAIYPAITPHLIQYPVHNYPLLYSIGTYMEYLAVVIEIIALGRLRTSFSQVPEAHRLVTTGLYRFIRHPFYSAYLIGFCGLALMVNQPLLWSAYGVFVFIEIVRARAEERVLMQTFPEYAVYKQKTGMFFPKVVTRP